MFRYVYEKRFTLCYPVASSKAAALEGTVYHRSLGSSKVFRSHEIRRCLRSAAKKMINDIKSLFTRLLQMISVVNPSQLIHFV